MSNNKDSKDDIEKLEKSIIGNIFLANLLDGNGDLDNSGQNLAMYMEYQQIKEIMDKDDTDNSK